jgi:hypothetical protein
MNRGFERVPERGEVLDAIRSWLDATVGLPHWADVGAQLQAALAALKAGIKQGETLAELADRVRLVLGGASQDRAERIARPGDDGSPE